MSFSHRRFLVTGANGFIGKNLVVRLNEFPNIIIDTFVRSDDPIRLRKLIAMADAVIHLAGENRPLDDSAFTTANVRLTSDLCNAIEQEFEITGRHVPLIFTSSIYAEDESPYGKSKLAAEETLRSLTEASGNPCVVFRLPGVFGKWCKPYYNSVVATFCHNIAHGLPIQINDPLRSLMLVHVDNVIDSIINALKVPPKGYNQLAIEKQFTITLGELAKKISFFSESRNTCFIDRVGCGFVRELYSTYISYMPSNNFAYQIPQYIDQRGKFVEMVKTLDSGQFSYFTAHPGITRGGHYHHTKTEKFLVIKGQGLFRFRHLLTKELVELKVSYDKPTVVETIPGWSHDITNIGDDEMIVMLWANETFDQKNPDTVASEI